MLLVGDDHVLSAYSGYIVALGGFCQIGGSLLAVFFISQCVELHKEELLAIENDAEVELLDRKAAEISLEKKGLVDWKDGSLSIVVKIMLVVALLFMSASCYIFFLLPTRCFVDFELTDSIDEKLDGSVFNLVKNLGWAGIALFVGACVFLWVYYKIVRRMLRKHLAEQEPRADDPKAEGLREQGITLNKQGKMVI
jgi:hypothetical protein